ncbi:MAG TPA: hypothetical protein VJR92_13170 [Gemmatimonadaceae bacterium]|nr:hypothetical protein [Gemmatimonadaceae bacterium]
MNAKHIVGFAVGLGAFFLARSTVFDAIGSYKLKRWKGDTPYERAFVRALRTENAFDDLVRFVRSTGTVSATRDSATYLTRAGLTRLSPDDQALRLVLIDNALGAASIETCASYHAGTPTPLVNELTAAMDSASLDQFAGLVVRAMVSELRKTGETTTLSEQQTIDFLESVTATLDSAAANRLMDALMEPAKASPQDMCWAGRTVYQTALGMDGPKRAEAVRVVTGLEAMAPAPK